MTDSVELARYTPVRPLPVHEVARAMHEYQQGIAAVVDASDWQVFVDRGGGDRRFLKRSGWRKIATWFGLDLLVGSAVVERDEQGRPLRARVIGRAVHPNGRTCEDVGACSVDERHFSKPEHDLVSTATTRALNRAIANLVGMGDLSAEELDSDGDVIVPTLPEWAQAADADFERQMLEWLDDLVGAERALALGQAIDARYGCTPNVVVGIVRALHGMLVPEAQQRPSFAQQAAAGRSSDFERTGESDVTPTDAAETYAPKHDVAGGDEPWNEPINEGGSNAVQP
jgi:hypothetical protein